YRTAAGRQHKVYLGRAEDLTPDRLTEAATTLARRVAAAAELVDGTPAAPGASPGRAGQGTAGLPLLATKLFVPRPRPDLVPRPRLLARLDVGPGAGRCTLLSAPAGAGKTSLLAAWLAQLDRPAGSPVTCSWPSSQPISMRNRHRRCSTVPQTTTRNCATARLERGPSGGWPTYGISGCPLAPSW
ncbi:MAG TPA: hypothetical protein VG411_14495, partial [Actinomycetota bacterium]|nr:hypothetical protein [Actinomycetota bacterium]